MGIGTNIYNIVLLLHVATAIVGFGGMIAHGAYNAKAFRSPASEAATIMKTTQSAAKMVEYAVYAVMPLGVVLISVSDKAFSMGAPWVSAAFVVWFVVVGLFHAMIRPAQKVFAARAEEIAPTTVLSADPEAEASSRKLMIGELGVQVMTLVALYLMVWQPGN